MALIFLKYVAILLAIVGGVLATMAYFWSQRLGATQDEERKVRAAYLASYIAMSLSIFALALHGLLA